MIAVTDKLIQAGLNTEAEKLEVLDARQASMALKIPVMGGMKSGKSTLLARLLGVDEDFFPKDMVEATAKNVNVSYGPFPMRTYTMPDGLETSVSDNELWNQLVCGHSGKNFTRLDIQLPDSLLNDGELTFVDTPGNNTCDDYKATETWKALADSQAGIYCLKATALMERSDLTFLQEAKYYLNDFIFVITRIDEAGGKNVSSDIAEQLVAAAKNKLEEFHIHPLAVLPISALAEKIEDSGIPSLRTCIENIVKKQGVALRNHQVYKQGVRILESSKIDLDNSLQIARKASGTTEEHFAEQKGILQSKLVDLNAEMENSSRRLEKKIESLRLNSEKMISQFSDDAIARIESRLSEMTAYSQVKEAGDSVVRSEIDKWRQDVQRYLAQLPGEISAMEVESSDNFVSQLHDSVLSAMDVNLEIQIADIDEDLSAKTYADEYLEDITKQKTELLKEIDSIQQEISNSGEKIPELERKLAEAKTAVQSLHYEPVYDQVERKKSGSATPFLKTLGSLADIAMIFLPTGWITGVGKIGVAGSKLPKIAKVVKTGSKISGAGKIIAKIPGKGKKGGVNPFEFLSLEFWGEKLGNLIDGQDGSEPEFEQVENQEVLGEFLRKKSALEAICNQSMMEYAKLESFINEKQKTLDVLKQQNLELSADYKKAEEEVRAAQKDMKASLERSELAKWKKSTLVQINKLFYSPQSELLRPVVTALAAYFKDCTAQARQNLINRLSATISQVEEQLSGNNLAFSQEKSVCDTNLAAIRNQIECVEEILKLPEELWFSA